MELLIKVLFCQTASFQTLPRTTERRFRFPACCQLTKRLILINSEGGTHVEFWQLVFMLSTLQTAAVAGILFTLLLVLETSVVNQVCVAKAVLNIATPPPPPPPHRAPSLLA